MINCEIGKHISAYVKVQLVVSHSMDAHVSEVLSVVYLGVDLGGSRGAPPIIELVGQRYPFAPPKKVQVRIFENIETTSETKTKNLTTTRNTTRKIVISIIYTRYYLQNLKNF